jgi:hypothetical protein
MESISMAQNLQDYSLENNLNSLTIEKVDVILERSYLYLAPSLRRVEGLMSTRTVVSMKVGGKTIRGRAKPDTTTCREMVLLMYIKAVSRLITTTAKES